MQNFYEVFGLRAILLCKFNIMPKISECINHFKTSLLQTVASLGCDEIAKQSKTGLV